MLNEGLKLDILALSLILGGIIQSFPIKDDVCCRSFKDFFIRLRKHDLHMREGSQKWAVFCSCVPRDFLSSLAPMLVVLSEHFIQTHEKEMLRGCRLPFCLGP